MEKKVGRWDREAYDIQARFRELGIKNPVKIEVERDNISGRN